MLSACKRYTEGKNDEPITIEYVMLRDINDSLKDAHNLAKCLNGIPSKVNLIPFNKFPGTYFSSSSHETIDAFREQPNNVSKTMDKLILRMKDLGMSVDDLTRDMKNIPDSMRTLQNALRAKEEQRTKVEQQVIDLREKGIMVATDEE